MTDALETCPCGCIRQDSEDFWWLMNQHWKGWSSWGIAYPSLEDLILYQQCRPVEQREDKWGIYWTVTKGETPQFLKCSVIGNSGNDGILPYPPWVEREL